VAEVEVHLHLLLMHVRLKMEVRVAVAVAVEEALGNVRGKTEVLILEEEAVDSLRV
jgi:hypothetical protein